MTRAPSKSVIGCEPESFSGGNHPVKVNILGRERTLGHAVPAIQVCLYPTRSCLQLLYLTTAAIVSSARSTVRISRQTVLACVVIKSCQTVIVLWP